MRRLLPSFLVIAAFLAFGSSSLVHAQFGSVHQYPGGWNLVALPPGSSVSGSATLYTMQPGDSDYEALTAANGLQPGYGYWVSLNGTTPVVLGTGSTAPYDVTPAAGQPVFIGDPSGILPAAVSGADFVYVYDPTNGWSAVTTLQPGQGAMAVSASGSDITVTPFGGVSVPQSLPVSGGSVPSVSIPATSAPYPSSTSYIPTGGSEGSSGGYIPTGSSSGCGSRGGPGYRLPNGRCAVVGAQ